MIMGGSFVSEDLEKCQFGRNKKLNNIKKGFEDNRLNTYCHCVTRVSRIAILFAYLLATQNLRKLHE